MVSRTEVRTARSAIESEIEQELGIVPTFFGRIPDELLPAEWSLFRHFELGDTRIPAKYKQLMGIALHSETKCRYCTLFHTEMARLCGATDEEIQEAAHFAKHSLGWSAYLNGMRVDEDEFARELQEAGEFLAKKGA